MKWKNICVWLMGLLAVGCFEDDTTVDTSRISEISIDTNSLQKVYDRDKNQPLVINIADYVTQKEKDLPLSYQWEMNYEFYSDSSVLVVDCRHLGEYPMRVKVSNEHGSAFYEFKLNVNSPYEEGLVVLSEANDGTGMVSFMRSLSDGTTGDFASGCLLANNPGVTFPKHPTDVRKRGGQLFVSYKDEPSIYVLNAKTLEVENVIKAPEYPDFVPVSMMLFDNEGRSATVLAEGGKAYNLALLEGLILENTMFQSRYSSVNHMYASADGWSQYSYLWDNTKDELVMTEGYFLFTFSEFDPGKNTGHEVVAIFDDKKDESFTVLTSLNGEVWKTTLGNYLSTPELMDAQRVIANPVLKQEDPKVASPLYQCLFYAKGNKVYQWYYSSSKFPELSDSWVSIDDLQGAEITAMGISPDESRVYVGVCRPDEVEQNGYVYIYETRTGRLIDSYKNVAYKPLKIMYKVK